jgi:hypothetical protein
MTKGIFMKKLIITAAIVASVGGLAACGSAGRADPVAPVVVRVTQTVAPTPVVTKTVTPAPTPTVTKTVISSPVVPAAPAPELVNAQAVVTQFYADINDDDFADAWNIGGDNIAGPDYDAWVAGFANTQSVILNSWGYFGSDEVTVDLTAPQSDGSVQTYQGTYTVENGVIVSASIIETS